jgi:transcriptional regulator with XRE-family HTH domain
MLPSEEDHLRRQRRQSWWLHAARLVSGRTQGDAATALGFSASSSYGDFERGITAPSLRQLAILATLYEVPLSLFTEPPQTDEERLEELTGSTSKRTDLVATERTTERTRRSRSQSA